MEVFLLVFYVTSKNKKHFSKILVLPCVFAIIHLLLVFILVEDSPPVLGFYDSHVYAYVFVKDYIKEINLAAAGLFCEKFSLAF